MPRKHPTTILALDPGTRELGYAVLSGHRLVTAGALALRLLPKAERGREARTRITALVKAHRPGAIVAEKTFRHPVPWLNELHDLTLFARRQARRFGANFYAYAPQRVRATVAGNGKAKKAEVALAIAQRFPALRVYLTQDRRWKERLWLNMFDALALALHHQSLN